MQDGREGLLGYARVLSGVLERNIKRHIIAARNVIFGSTNFLILPLPDSWKLGALIIPPEVDANKMVNEIQWVREGQIGHALYDFSGKGVIELIIKVLRGRREPVLLKNISINLEGEAEASGHRVRFYSGERSRGLLQKKKSRILYISFYCDSLDRTILLQFATESSIDLCSLLIPCIPFIQCH